MPLPQGYLVLRVAVENAPVDVVAAETGLDPVQQVVAARAALAALALEYESVRSPRPTSSTPWTASPWA